MIKSRISKLLKQFNYDLVRLDRVSLPIDFEPEHQEIALMVAPFTMTSPERIFGLIEAVKYVSRSGIEGDIVECGVWKGGSMLAIAEMLVRQNDQERELFLYDTFEGMPPPGIEDVSIKEEQADQLLQKETNKEKNLVWAYSSLETVKKTLAFSKYSPDKIHYVKGKVEETIPSDVPEKISLLRLDTDWYESTKHELNHLFPRLQKGGVLIIDDYGHWKGARKAVDEYFAENKIQILLNRMDETGRIAIKQ